MSRSIGSSTSCPAIVVARIACVPLHARRDTTRRSCCWRTVTGVFCPAPGHETRMSVLARVLLALAIAVSPIVGVARQVPGAVRLSNPSLDVAQYFGLTPQFAVSPDGRQLVFVASPPNRSPLLWVRSLGALDPRPLPGTDQASYPFWSADGKSIGFFAAGKLKTVPATGGTPVIVCDAPTGRGGT